MTAPTESLDHPPCASSLIFELYEEEANPSSRHVAVWFNSRPLKLSGLRESVAPGYYAFDDMEKFVLPNLLTDEQFRAQCRV